jgi:hypothetical protein
MKPDFGEVVARGMVEGVVGLLSRPLVIVTLIIVIGVSVLAGRQRRRRWRR